MGDISNHSTLRNESEVKFGYLFEDVVLTQEVESQMTMVKRMGYF